MPLTQQQLGRHLWEAADILRGRIDSGEYKHYIFGLLFLQSAGELALIDDPELRASLANYYVTVALRRGPGMYELLPEYRETVRGAVPSSIMRYYWTACHDQDQVLQTLIECASPVAETEVRRILEDIVSRPRLVPELRFWIDTLELMTRLAADDIEAAEVLGGSVSEARQ